MENLASLRSTAFTRRDRYVRLHHGVGEPLRAVEFGAVWQLANRAGLRSCGNRPNVGAASSAVGDSSGPEEDPKRLIWIAEGRGACRS